MSIKITTVDKDGNKVITNLSGNVLKGYTINNEGVYKTEDIPSDVKVQAESKQVKNRFIFFLKGLIKYVNKKDNTK